MLPGARGREFFFTRGVFNFFTLNERGLKFGEDVDIFANQVKTSN